MKKIRIGTRGSPLALVQANTVKATLESAHPGLEAEIMVIRTSGDWRPEQGETLLSEQAGGKAQFAHEIEAALLAGTVDIGVHSSKDMDSNLPAGLVMECFLPREDVRDCLLIGPAARDEGLLFGLKQGAVFGTSSARRAAFMKHKRPDLVIQPLRGNVQTRLDKLAAGQVDATMLARAGLNRLGLAPEGMIALETVDFIPSAGQGAVGIECREDDETVRALLAAINHKKTALCVMAERALVHSLGGTCRSPIGALALWEGDMMRLRAAVASLDGAFYQEEQMDSPVFDNNTAAGLGQSLGAWLKVNIPPGLWDAA